MEALPAYIWPPVSWVERAHRLRTFLIAYPARLPKGSYYTRYRIADERWLSIPIIHATKNTPHTATWPSDKRWRLYHWRSLLTLYGKAPFFYEWKPFLEYLYTEADFTTLKDFAELIFQELGSLYSWQYEWSPYPVKLNFTLQRDEISILDQLLRFGT
ncbi:MAG: WbqC family protein [Bacteroidia bacterium]|nr:WbqC family protein [Bacteroidia bacterium]MCX7651422.1 WbqC family protein [Bacteroidia bacterium]MDW8417057.1 WbqC family protein [Bacteroidia bacterium]